LKDLAWVRQLTILWSGLDAVLEPVAAARREVRRLGRGHKMIHFWKELPGVGAVRAATIFAYLDTPGRFASAKKLYRYGGVGLKEFASGSSEDGSPRPGHLGLFRGVNRRLKSAVMGAALSAICQGDNPFVGHHRRIVRQGLTPSNARHAVARKWLRVMGGMGKTTRRYDARLV
jgi:transposase